jgi:hypothetical protein
MSYPEPKRIVLGSDDRHVYAKTRIHVRLKNTQAIYLSQQNNNSPFIHATINNNKENQSFVEVKIINNIKRDGAGRATNNQIQTT